ncbi:MAG: preprotein translocase subunit SecG [Chitinophagaceae bacterium]|jgi:preprotein translocase subunit SecG|nr:preprotein translocase subunit SecG [Chitinophagaceae bacterium]MBP6589210.1 preprotein translocase subunit SecG [Chitinophagaceae bacterium]
MTTLFIVLVVLASVILGLIVLVQNPKGGGLTGNIAGFSNQFMGVKQTTDVLERGTWIFAGVIGLLSLLSVIFISGNASSATDRTKEAAGATVPASSQPTVPANTVPAVPTTTPPVTTPK